MAATMPELRTPVMIFVEAAWEGEQGGLQTFRACMEDKSAGGACIRLKTSVPMGSKIRIRWRFEEFFGVVKYCRSEGREFVVGIQRNNAIHFSEASQSRPAAVEAGATKIAKSENQVSQTESPKNGFVQPEAVQFSRSAEVANAPGRSADVVPRTPPRGFARHAQQRRPQGRDRPQPQQEKGTQELLRAREAVAGDSDSKPAPEQQEAKTKRSFMGNKWLARAPWNQRDEEPAVRVKESGKEREESAAPVKEKIMPLAQPTQIPEKPAPYVAREVPTFQVELLSMEDIYRTAGIVSPRKGYSITKIVEMLNSEHIRGLSKETKRAAILMALDGAGVTIEQVQRDARARQGALDAYENEQRKQTEAEWARKAEEITHIQAELESIKAHYTARISRNMEALARDKARFNNWVTTKEQESQSMAEAIDLCTKIPSSEPVATAPSHPASLAAEAGKSSAASASKPM